VYSDRYFGNFSRMICLIRASSRSRSRVREDVVEAQILQLVFVEASLVSGEG